MRPQGAWSSACGRRPRSPAGEGGRAVAAVTVPVAAEVDLSAPWCWPRAGPTTASSASSSPIATASPWPGSARPPSVEAPRRRGASPRPRGGPASWRRRTFAGRSGPRPGAPAGGGPRVRGRLRLRPRRRIVARVVLAARRPLWCCRRSARPPRRRGADDGLCRARRPRGRRTRRSSALCGGVGDCARPPCRCSTRTPPAAPAWRAPRRRPTTRPPWGGRSSASRAGELDKIVLAREVRVHAPARPRPGAGARRAPGRLPGLLLLVRRHPGGWPSSAPAPSSWCAATAPRPDRGARRHHHAAARTPPWTTTWASSCSGARRTGGAGDRRPAHRAHARAGEPLGGRRRRARCW